MKRPARVLAIGLDGATLDLLIPLCRCGLMPNLQHLLATGASGVLHSTVPTVTPVAWTSFLTGCPPRCHGVLDFQRLDRCGRHLALNTAESIRCPTLFDWLHDHGRSTVSINLPMTYPSRWPGSLIVGGFDCPSTARALADYPEFARQLRRRAPPFSVEPIWRRRPADASMLRHCLKKTERAFRARVEAARVSDQLCNWTLMFIQFQDLDGMQHRIWDRLCRATEGGIVSPESHAVRTTIIVLDHCLGELFELANRHDAALCIVSDHGFGCFTGAVNTNRLLQQAGIVVTSGGWQAIAYTSGKAARRLHKWAYRRRHPGGSTAALRRTLTAQFPFDWQKTLAWSPHGDLGSMIYLNSPERFGRGPINTSRLRREVLDRLGACFGEARHPATGQPLFTQVIDVADQFGRDPVDEQWPDLLAIPAAGIHTQSKLREEWFSNPPCYTGTHRQQGVWVLNGPGIDHSQDRPANIEDIAPTLLALLGLSHDGHCRGTVLHEVPNRPIHEPKPTAANGPTTSARWRYRPEEERRIEQHLESLGYLQ